MVTRTRYRTTLFALFASILLLAPLAHPDLSSASAQVTGRAGGAGGGKIRVGCGALLDANGKAVAQEAGRGSGAGLPAHCTDITQAAPDPAPPPEPEPKLAPVLESPVPTKARSPAPTAPAKRRTVPSPMASAHAPVKPKAATPTEFLGTLEVAHTERESNGMGNLSVDPANAGIALVAGGIMVWLLRSGVFASMLLFGLPIWRDVDLLAVVESEHAIATKGPHGDAGERLFSEASDSPPSKSGRSHA